jgi:hypothetical protein
MNHVSLFVMDHLVLRHCIECMEFLIKLTTSMILRGPSPVVHSYPRSPSSVAIQGEVPMQ